MTETPQRHAAFLCHLRRRRGGVWVGGCGTAAWVYHATDPDPRATASYGGAGAETTIVVALRYSERLAGPTVMFPAGREAEAVAFAAAWVRALAQVVDQRPAMPYATTAASGATFPKSQPSRSARRAVAAICLQHPV